MRFDVKSWAEMDKAVYNYRSTKSSEPMILVLHTAGNVAYRFIVGTHGIERQECDVKGDVRE